MEIAQLIRFDERVLVLFEPVEAECRSTELLLADLAISVLIAPQDEDLGKTVAIATAVRSNLRGIGCDFGRIRFRARAARGRTDLVTTGIKRNLMSLCIGAAPNVKPPV